MVNKDAYEMNGKKGSPHAGEPTQKKSKSKSQHTDATDKKSKAAAEHLEQEAAEAVAEELEELDALASALEEAQELRDRHLRLKAEWENYRKRTESERADERSRASQRLVEKLMPIMDDLERAIEHSDSVAEEPLREGVAQVYTKMMDALASEGVKVIDPKGEPFDANKHSAISKVEDKNVPDETVVEVYQKGYEMGSRVLRPAMVVVSCK